MLKIRIIPTLLYKDTGLVKDQQFASNRPIGGALQAMKVYSLREVDELVLLDVSATRNGRGPDFTLIDDLADECFMPFSVGGGVRTTADIRNLLMVGADKVILNTAAFTNSGLIGSGAINFGSQCIVVSVDVWRGQDGSLEVFSHCGTQATGRHPVDWARQAESEGAGEILLTSINRDGMMNGYDLDLISAVTCAVSIPVIASGGAGNYTDMEAAICQGNAAAVAASSIFQFTEQTPLAAKRHLHSRGIPVRL